PHSPAVVSCPTNGVTPPPSGANDKLNKVPKKATKSKAKEENDNLVQVNKQQAKFIIDLERKVNDLKVHLDLLQKQLLLKADNPTTSQLNNNQQQQCDNPTVEERLSSIETLIRNPSTSNNAASQMVDSASSLLMQQALIENKFMEHRLRQLETQVMVSQSLNAYNSSMHANTIPHNPPYPYMHMSMAQPTTHAAQTHICRGTGYSPTYPQMHKPWVHPYQPVYGPQTNMLHIPPVPTNGLPQGLPHVHVPPIPQGSQTHVRPPQFYQGQHFTQMPVPQNMQYSGSPNQHAPQTRRMNQSSLIASHDGQSNELHQGQGQTHMLKRPTRVETQPHACSETHTVVTQTSEKHDPKFIGDQLPACESPLLLNNNADAMRGAQRKPNAVSPHSQAKPITRSFLSLPPPTPKPPEQITIDLTQITSGRQSV
ncbi:MAG: hypothetical protein ABW185_00895, partial [Sedimenticola sp.]